jgi:hypothetical protein
MTGKKQIILGAFIIFSLVVGFGIFLYFQPSQSFIKTKPDYLVTAQQLVKDYSENESSANKKYLGAIVEITGKVVSKNEGNEGLWFISFIDPINGLTCAFDASQTEKIISVSIGDEITVKGRCDGKLSDVRLSKCSIKTED